MRRKAVNRQFRIYEFASFRIQVGPLWGPWFWGQVRVAVFVYRREPYSDSDVISSYFPRSVDRIVPFTLDPLAPVVVA